MSNSNSNWKKMEPLLQPRLTRAFRHANNLRNIKCRNFGGLHLPLMMELNWYAYTQCILNHM